MSCLALVLFLLGLSFGGSAFAWSSGIVIALIIVSPLLVLVTLVYEFLISEKINPKSEERTYRPLLSWRIVPGRAVYTANIMTSLPTVSYNGQMIYSVQYFQTVFGSTAWKAGLHLIPIVVSSVIAAIIGGVITKKTGNVKLVLLFGSSVGVIGAGLMTLLDNYLSARTQIGVLILPGVALGAKLQADLIGSQLAVDLESPSAQFDFIEVTAFNSYIKYLGATMVEFYPQWCLTSQLMNLSSVTYN